MNFVIDLVQISKFFDKQSVSHVIFSGPSAWRFLVRSCPTAVGVVIIKVGLPDLFAEVQIVDLVVVFGVLLEQSFDVIVVHDLVADVQVLQDSLEVVEGQQAVLVGVLG